MGWDRCPGDSLVVSVAMSRLKNLGCDRFWARILAFGSLVPVLGLPIVVCCLTAPEGYEDYKKLDRVGKFALVVTLLFVVLVCVNWHFAMQGQVLVNRIERAAL